MATRFRSQACFQYLAPGAQPVAAALQMISQMVAAAAGDGAQQQDHGGLLGEMLGLPHGTSLEEAQVSLTKW